MTLFELLISQAAGGSIKPHQLLASIRAGMTYTAGARGARFTKTRPGAFEVLFYLDDMGKPAETTEATSPVEAKLTVIDYLIEGVQESSEEPQAQPTPTKQVGKTRR